MSCSAAGPRRRPRISPTMVPSIGSTAGRLNSQESHGNHCVGGTEETQDPACTAGLRAHVGIHHGVSLAAGVNSALGGVHPQRRIGMGPFLGGRYMAAGIGVPALELWVFTYGRLF